MSGWVSLSSPTGAAPLCPRWREAAVRRFAAIALSGVAATLAGSGCARTSAPSSHATTPLPTHATLGASSAHTGPLLTGTIVVSGGKTASASFSTPAEMQAGSARTAPPGGSTCADFANGFHQDGFTLTTPDVKTSADESVYLQASMAHGYKGPGPYSSRSTPSLSGTAVFTAGDPNAGGFFSVFKSSIQAATPPTTTLTVTSGGSGTLVLSGWGGEEGDISGTVSWTCH
jgi:hypothetical protein